MYLNTRQKKKMFMISCIFFCFVAAVFIYTLLQRGFVENLYRVENVVLSNVNENSVTITWVTDRKFAGSVMVYENGEILGEYEDLRNIGRSKTHYVNIHSLKPDTSYEFKILLGSKEIFNEGEMFSFGTQDIPLVAKSSDVVRGFVENLDSLIFILFDDSEFFYPIVTSPAKNGEWVLDLAQISAVSRYEQFELRKDLPIKVLSYSDSDSKVVRGNRNKLFDENGLLVESGVILNSEENIFVHMSDFVRFKDVLVENERRFVQEESEPENIMGVEDIDDAKMKKLDNYGLN